jgi:hypothetical protein
MKWLTCISMLLFLILYNRNSNAADTFTARENTFEFTENPHFIKEKEKEKVKIQFAVKSYCDVTITILNENHEIIRHLASGVLGKNAPQPFLPNSLTQIIEWDGLDDKGDKTSLGFKLKVSLGLMAKYSDSLLWHSHDLAPISAPINLPAIPFVAKGNNGLIYVAVPLWLGWHGRIYKSDGTYLRTFWPPPASEFDKYLDQLYGPGNTESSTLKGNVEMRPTLWGDNVFSAPIHGPFESSPFATKINRDNIFEVIRRISGGEEAKLGSLPEEVATKCPPTFAKRGGLFEKVLGTHHWIHMTVNKRTDELYVCGRDLNYQDKPVCLYRLNGKTGALDSSWFSKGEFRCMNAYVGPDDNIYTRVGAFGQWILRLDKNGKSIDFQENGVLLPHKKYADNGKLIAYEDGWSKGIIDQSPKVLWTGKYNWGRVQERGLYVSQKGMIVLPVESVGQADELGKQYGLPDTTKDVETYVQIWENSGKRVTSNAIGDMRSGNGVAMDREGNLYAAILNYLPEKQISDAKTCYIFGLKKSVSINALGGVGSWIKFKKGSNYPLSITKFTDKGESVNEGVSLLSNGTLSLTISNPEWIWSGLSSQGGGCSCHHVRPEMDYYARQWIPTNHLNSIVVLDSNGNLIVRFGCYGNVDDSLRDIKAGQDGLRFAWIKSITTSDNFLYVADRPNRRILKALISYHQEKELSLFDYYKSKGNLK